jgi:tRNA pseudouridine38-40 synthase
VPRYRLTIEYDGGPYNGFQAQPGLPTVQGAIEAAVKAFCGQDLRVHGAGRTDTGVHALGQVVHIDLERNWPVETVRNALNFHLMRDSVVVLEAALGEGDWHARFSATERRYLYRILNRHGPPGLERGKVWHVKSPLDAQAMHEAAQILVGHHDFTTFRDLRCQANSPMKTLDFARVSRVGQELHLHFGARSFLHRQVRSMTGTLVEVGLGKWDADDVAYALAACDRTACGPVAPSTGLYLTAVGYEPLGENAAK